MGEWADEYTLLCEGCGYVIEGLPKESTCPECGRPIAESLPERRIGMPWQRHPGVLSWAVTNALPSQSWEFGKVEWYDSWRLLILNLVVASILPWPILMLIQGAAFPLVMASVALSVPTFVVLFLLTMTERAGLGFWGGRRGSRVTLGSTTTVCAIASSGWLLLVLVPAGYAIGTGLRDLALIFGFGWGGTTFLHAPIWLSALGFAASLLAFEFLAFMGMRRMRFANRMR